MGVVICGIHGLVVSSWMSAGGRSFTGRRDNVSCLDITAIWEVVDLRYPILSMTV